MVRRSAGRRRRAARWRADALSSPPWHGGRCGVRRAGRAVVRGSGRASPTSPPLLIRGQSLWRARTWPHANARAATASLKPMREDRIGATQGPRVPSGHTRGLRVAPTRSSREGFGLAMAARAFACGRIRGLRRGCPRGRRVEEEGERRQGAGGRGGGWRGGRAGAVVVEGVMCVCGYDDAGIIPGPSKDRGPRQMLP